MISLRFCLVVRLYMMPRQVEMIFHVIPCRRELKQAVLIDQHEDKVEDHLEEVACLHAVTHYLVTEQVRRDALATDAPTAAATASIESIYVLKVIFFGLAEALPARILENAVRSGSVEERSTRIQVPLPVLLHHAVHDMRFHYFEGVKFLEVVK